MNEQHWSGRSNISIYQRDCLDAMREMEDNAFDLAIVDPPYGIGEDGSNNKSRGNLVKACDYKGFFGGDKTPPSEDFFQELFRVSENQIIWGANHFMSKIKIDSPSWVVWDKVNGTNDFADCELAFTSHKKAVRKFDFMWSGMMQGSSSDGRIQEGNKKKNEKRIHPTQKPVKLYEWLLMNYAKEGDKILDTHLGSGSHAIACWNLNFDLTAFELDPDYFKATTKRIEKHTRQIQMF